MPDWTVRRRLLGAQPAWHILPEDNARGQQQHPFRIPEQDVIKWQNHLYAVTKRSRRAVTYVAVPLPPGTAIGRESESSDDDSE